MQFTSVPKDGITNIGWDLSIQRICRKRNGSLITLITSTQSRLITPFTNFLNSTFTTWRETVPRDFTFAVKASRFITHMKKLKEPKTSTEKFFKRSERLEDKLGAILFQLPPGWQLNCDRLAEFLDAIPSEGQYAFEFRNESWLQNDVYDLLRRHNIAFCIHDFRGKGSPREITSDFAYVRMHGPGEVAYAGSYPLAVLKKWAQQIKDWRKDLEAIYIYFNNDFQGYAVKNATKLRQLI